MKNKNYNKSKLVCKTEYVRIILVVLCFGWSANLWSQTICAKVKIIDEQQETENNLEQTFTNYLALQAYKNELLKGFWEKGQFSAHLIEQKVDSQQFFITLIAGPALIINKINLKHIDPTWQRLLRRQLDIDNILLTEINVQSLLEKALQVFENNGFPFAQVWLDSFSLHSKGYEACLLVDQGPGFVFYALEIDKEVKINNDFLLNYLDIKNGEPFNYKKINAIPERISSLPFLKLVQAPSLSFSDEGKVRVWLNLENEQVSSFDGIVGIAPNSSKTGQTLVTGQLDFKLRNPFARGTSFDFAFEKFQESSQKLNMLFEYPFLFSTSLGTKYQFDLQRVDSTYINLNSRIGISYFFSGNSKLNFFYNQARAYPLSSLPQILSRYSNVDSRFYGMGYDVVSVDYLPNPLKGFEVKTEASIGKKTVIRVEGDDIESTVSNVSSKISAYIPLAKRATILLRNQINANIDSSFSQSQVIWLGGLRTIRGYNESSIPSKSFVLQTIELRYLTDRNSHAKVFYDLASLSQVSNTGKISNTWLSGFGLGYNFKTGPGIFTISYAVAAANSQTISLTNGKVHFGFLSYF